MPPLPVPDELNQPTRQAGADIPGKSETTVESMPTDQASPQTRPAVEGNAETRPASRPSEKEVPSSESPAAQPPGNEASQSKPSTGPVDDELLPALPQPKPAAPKTYGEPLPPEEDGFSGTEH